MIFFLYIFWIFCWFVIYFYGNGKKICFFNFCIIYMWCIKFWKKMYSWFLYYLLICFGIILKIFYMISVYLNKWLFKMYFNIFNDWIRWFVYIWLNYSIYWLLEDFFIIIIFFVLLLKFSVMNELWF